MTFYIIGIDDNKEQHFTPEILDVIAANTIFSGGIRHKEIVASYLPSKHEWIDITVPLDKVFAHYSAHTTIVVFASGDPLFFGFANTIQREMPHAQIVLFPHFNSLQLLAHRVLMPYHDMYIVSLTGRPWHKFDEALITGREKIGVLTDNREHTPASIAKRMLQYGYDNYSITVGEQLGNRQHEKITTLSLDEAILRDFKAPNNLILQKTHTRPRPFGIPESEFNLLNGRAKMITKMPVRLLSLSLLELRDKSVFWDIGFCTGSVSVEAKLQFPHLQIVAFEQREEGKALLESNAQKFGTPGITALTGDFTQTDISSLPKPDAVFIGGHGGKMHEIIDIVKTVLVKNGTIVFNAVSDESRTMFLQTIEAHKLKHTQSVTITIDNHNSIDVMQAKSE